MSQQDNFDDLFAPESSEEKSVSATPWKVLLVDDEPDIHAILRLALQDVEIEGHPLDLIEANSGANARHILEQQTDIALILLDVVMESNSSGLELVNYIRNELNNSKIQILLVTGQPGYAPQHEVITEFEINGYYLKTELTSEKIFSAVYSSLRNYKMTLEFEQQHIELQASEKRYFDLYENSPDMYVSVNAKTAKVRECNQTLSKKLGYRKSEIIGQSIFDLYHPDCMDDVKLAFKSFIETGVVNNAELQLKRKDGKKIDVNLNVTSVRDESGNILYSRSCWIDITERKKLENELKLAAKVFIHASEGITITDVKGNILDINDAFSSITGYSRDEVIGKNPKILQSGHHDKHYYESMWHDLQEHGHWSGEIWNRRKNGEVYAEMLNINAVTNSEGKVQQYVALFSDITIQKKHQKQLEHIAHFDALTNLPNRVLLADRLERSMIQEQRRHKQLAVIFLDLDQFKEVNDTHGHDVGDQLLIKISQRLNEALREDDTIARFGGDEFVIVLSDLLTDRDCVPILERLVDAAALPVNINELTLQVSASLGVTFYPQEESIDADQLLRQADQAMYQAKLSGKNRCQFFDMAQDRTIRGHNENIERIRQALVNDEFVLYYQPKIDLCTGRVQGAEALIRWQHPDKGLLPPAAFLPTIEGEFLAAEIDNWVIETAIAQLNFWHQSGHDFSISVNVGPLCLEQAGFIQYIKDKFDAYPELDIHLLELEVLESSALKDISLVSKVIENCKNIGVSFALDDFGTGYSSLTYLKNLPAKTLKIDQSFVRDMLVQADDLAIIEGIIGLARAFDREVIAEGIETMEHARKLYNMGCKAGQGYAFAKPMPADEIINWKSNWKPESTIV